MFFSRRDCCVDASDGGAWVAEHGDGVIVEMIDVTPAFYALTSETMADNARNEWIQGFNKAIAAVPDFTLNDAAMLLGQCHRESGGFTDVVENLDYSDPVRLQRIYWGQFKTVDAAKGYLHQPEALANKVYAHRLGNRDLGDGWRYIGRGPLQITGRDEYEALFHALGMPPNTDPNWLVTPFGGAHGAVWFWGWKPGLRSAARRLDHHLATLLVTGAEDATEVSLRSHAANTALAALVARDKPPVAMVQGNTPKPAVTADDLNTKELTQLGA